MLHAIVSAYRPKHGRRLRICGFTLIEMLVTVAILGVLAALCTTAALSARSRARATNCLANQRDISQAMLAHYTDHGAFPSDGPDCLLAMQLEDYVPWEENARSVALPQTWRCPSDRNGPLSNSYEPYYVRREEPADGRYFVLGCPRHSDTDRSCVNLHGTSDLLLAAAGSVDINGKTTTADAPLEQRTAHSGTVKFEDGSTAQLSPISADFGVSVVASFRNDNGTLYTVVRVTGKGDTDFQVTKGSRFEVVTPVAIIGVRGTTFNVYNEPAFTRVDLYTGKVVAWTRASNLPVSHWTDDGKNLLGVEAVGDSTIASLTTSTAALELTPNQVCEIGVREDPPVEEEAEYLDLRNLNPGKWQLRNLTNVNIPFAWDDNGGGEGGIGIATVRGKATFIYTHRDLSPETLRVFFFVPGKGHKVVTATAP